MRNKWGTNEKQMRKIWGKNEEQMRNDWGNEQGMKDPAESHSKCTWRDDLKKEYAWQSAPFHTL